MNVPPSAGRLTLGNAGKSLSLSLPRSLCLNMSAVPQSCWQHPDTCTKQCKVLDLVTYCPRKCNADEFLLLLMFAHCVGPTLCSDCIALPSLERLRPPGARQAAVLKSTSEAQRGSEHLLAE